MKIIIEGSQQEITTLISRREDVDINRLSTSVSQIIRKSAFKAKPHMEYSPSNEEIALTIQKLRELKQESSKPDGSNKLKGFTPDPNHSPYQPLSKKKERNTQKVTRRGILHNGIWIDSPEVTILFGCDVKIMDDTIYFGGKAIYKII